jgi:hypothetical protein
MLEYGSEPEAEFIAKANDGHIVQFSEVVK